MSRDTPGRDLLSQCRHELGATSRTHSPGVVEVERVTSGRRDASRASKHATCTAGTDVPLGNPPGDAVSSASTRRCRPKPVSDFGLTEDRTSTWSGPTTRGGTGNHYTGRTGNAGSDTQERANGSSGRRLRVGDAGHLRGDGCGGRPGRRGAVSDPSAPDLERTRRLRRPGRRVRLVSDCRGCVPLRASGAVGLDSECSTADEPARRSRSVRVRAGGFR
jgi:hypothetical protein